jgi:hypothetical protein
MIKIECSELLEIDGLNQFLDEVKEGNRVANRMGGYSIIEPEWLIEFRKAVQRECMRWMEKLNTKQ